MANVLTSIIFSGVLERFPRIRLVLGESGIGWIPYVLWRMDAEWEDQFKDLSLKMPPSEYWKRQCWATYQTDPDRHQAARRAGRRQGHVGLGLPASRRRVARLERVHPARARAPARRRAAARSSARTPRSSTDFRWPERVDRGSPRRRRAPAVTFFVPLIVEGALAGMVYALVALAFVLVYKASRMINFALGEWVVLGARLVATGAHGARACPSAAAVGLGDRRHGRLRRDVQSLGGPAPGGAASDQPAHGHDRSRDPDPRRGHADLRGGAVPDPAARPGFTDHPRRQHRPREDHGRRRRRAVHDRG